MMKKGKFTFIPFVHAYFRFRNFFLDKRMGIFKINIENIVRSNLEAIKLCFDK